jgi:hypothetical protein
MNDFLVHAHSGWRWIVLLLLIVAVFKALQGMKKNNSFLPKDKKIFLFAMIAYHIQFLGGLVLYFTSIKVNFIEGWMKSSLLRFFGMEHILLMLIAFVLITIGYSKSKKAEEDKLKFKKIFVFYLISLILILIAIPWPFREALGANWF